MFVYSLNVLNFKGMSSVNTSLSLKYNKTFKALPLHLYESTYTALGEGLMTNIALRFTSPRAIFAT